MSRQIGKHHMKKRYVSFTSEKGLTQNRAKFQIFSDTYHFLMETSWLNVVVLLAISFAGINFIFGLAYLECGDGIGNSANTSLLDSFFFSVQTFATVGYGFWYPKNNCANAIMSFEAFVQMLGTALITGLVFAKFSVTKSRVLFSNHIILSKHNKLPVLRFRIANARGNQIVEARISVTLLLNETNEEGEFIRRLHDLKLDRQTSPVFGLSWLVTHEIDSASPLWAMGGDDLKAREAQVIVSLVGIDNTSSQTLHARHLYLEKDFFWNVKFVDILGKEADGRRFIDYSKFHKLCPLP